MAKTGFHVFSLGILFLFGAATYCAENSIDIFKLIEEGEITEAVNLLNADQSLLQLKDGNGQSLLHAAARRGDISLITYLLRNGIEINIKDNNGNTPLFEAVNTKKEEAVNLLIQKSADINIMNNSQRTAIFYAARTKGNITLIKLLVEKGAKLNIKSNLGMTLLHYAIQANDTESVEFLLANGMDINAMDNRGRTPLMAAAALENGDLVKALVEKGANINTRHSNGNTPLMIAIDQGAIETVQYFLSIGSRTDIFNDQGSFPLHIAVERGETALVQLLMKKDVNVNIQNVFTGATPLHIAASRGYGDLVLFLLASGANPALKDNDGDIPLDLAVKHNNKTAKRILTEFGVEDNSKLADSSASLMDDLDTNEARIWYLLHCGWMVKTKNALLIFDYYPGLPHSRRPDEPSVANGRINPDEIKDLNVYVFVSHIHEDHFTTEIFDWKKTIPNIKYILGFQYKEAPDYTLAYPNKTYQIGDAVVTTVNESPGDVGYVVEIDGLTIFHGGDLSGWIPEMLANLKVQTDFIIKKGLKPDMIFMLGAGWTMPYFKDSQNGLYYLLDKLKPAVFLPMHNRRVELNNLMSGVQTIMDGKIATVGIGLVPGDVFKYKKGSFSPSPSLKEAKEFMEMFKKEFDEMKNSEDKLDDRSKIEELRKKDIEASLKGDTEMLLSLMTDDIVLIYPDQPPAKGIETIRKRMQAYKKELENIKITQYSYTMEELVIEGGLAYEWGFFHNKYFLKSDGKEIEEKGRMMRILCKQPDGSWKVSRSIWNSNPD